MQYSTTTQEKEKFLYFYLLFFLALSKWFRELVDNVALTIMGQHFNLRSVIYRIESYRFSLCFLLFFAQGANVVAVVSVIKSHQSPVFSRTDEPPLKHPADKTDTQLNYKFPLMRKQKKATCSLHCCVCVCKLGARRKRWEPGPGREALALPSR